MTKFKKRFFLLIIGEVTILLIFGLALYKFQKNITKKVNQASTYKKELARRIDTMTRVHNLELESEEARPYSARLEKFLPTDSDMVGLEGIFHDLAQKNSISLSFRFGLVNKGNDKLPPSYSFNLVLSGTSENILKWFQDFYHLPYSFHLEQIEIRQDYSASNSSNNHYTAKVLGRIYYRPSATSLPN